MYPGMHKYLCILVQPPQTQVIRRDTLVVGTCTGTMLQSLYRKFKGWFVPETDQVPGTGYRCWYGYLREEQLISPMDLRYPGSSNCWYPGTSPLHFVQLVNMHMHIGVPCEQLIRYPGRYLPVPTLVLGRYPGSTRVHVPGSCAVSLLLCFYWLCNENCGRCALSCERARLL